MRDEKYWHLKTEKCACHAVCLTNWHIFHTSAKPETIAQNKITTGRQRREGQITLKVSSSIYTIYRLSLQEKALFIVYPNAYNNQCLTFIWQGPQAPTWITTLICQKWRKKLRNFYYHPKTSYGRAWGGWMEKQRMWLGHRTGFLFIADSQHQPWLLCLTLHWHQNTSYLPHNGPTQQTLVIRNTN